MDQHKIMLSPRALGTITHIAEKGSYTISVWRLSRRRRQLSDDFF